MSEASPSQRIVLLGASNVAKSISTAVSVARSAFEGPIDLMAAMGHGRAYSCGTWVLGRTLPAMETCGLWGDISSRPKAPLSAVVMDVGNDIILGQSVDQILSSIETCLDRLQEADAKIQIVGLPLPVLEALGPWRFGLFLRLFFPTSKLRYEQGMSMARETHARLQECATARGAKFVEQDPSWYGLDPIHLTRRSWDAAWKKFFSITDERALSKKSALAPGRFLYLRSRTPHHRKLFGFAQNRAQPSARLSCDVAISWY